MIPRRWCKAFVRHSQQVGDSIIQINEFKTRLKYLNRNPKWKRINQYFNTITDNKLKFLSLITILHFI